MARPPPPIKWQSLLARPLPGRAVGRTGQIEGRVDQPDVGEGLREVAHQPPRLVVVLLTQEPDVVPKAEEPVEEGRRLVPPALHGEVVRVPEGARQERPLARWQPVLR